MNANIVRVIGRARRGRAFSLVELLVVVALFVILLAIGIPAFRAMLESSDEAMAENALRGGVAAARDAAARGGQGQDAAAVFFYDARTQKTSIVPCVRVGTLLDVDGSNNEVVREVFVPINGFEPAQLPRRWMARGYAPANTIDDDWYGATYASSIRDVGHWLFPENDFYNWTRGDEGDHRQTFMIRFEGGTGALKPADGNAVLVLSPAPTSEHFRNSGIFNNALYRIDIAADQGRIVRKILEAPFNSAGALTIEDRRDLLGDRSSDTLLVKPVRLLSLSNDERGLAGFLNLRMDRDTGSFYQNADQPTFVTGLDPLQLNEYINGADNTGPIETRARLFSVHRYLGTLQEITGTIDGEGVSQ